MIINRNTRIRLTAIPDEGYQFNGWNNGETENPFITTVNEIINYNNELRALFSLITSDDSESGSGIENPFGNEICPNDEIWYISSTNNVVNVSSWGSTYSFSSADNSSANIISNTYTNKGVIKFNKNVTKINDTFERIFPYSGPITAIYFPESIQIFPARMCKNTNIEYVIIPTEISIPEQAFLDCPYLQYIANTHGTIGWGTVNSEIGENAFTRCTSLYDININVEYIREGAFAECTNLTNINFYTGIKSIGINAFIECSNIESLEFPYSISSIAPNSFSGCTKLKNVYAVGGGGAISASWKDVFYRCPNLEHFYTIGGTDAYHTNYECGIIEYVTDAWGANLRKLVKATNTIAQKNIQLSYGVIVENPMNGIHEIGEYAFCDLNIESIDTTGVDLIDSFAFQNCTRLTSATISRYIQWLSSGIFANCSSLQSITIPDNIMYIDHSAFYECTNLRNVIFENNNHTGFSIGDYAFFNCNNLDITIPDWVTSIGENAFYNVYHIEYHGTATGAPWGALSMN